MSAWICGFSSIANTAAATGGDRYKPTRSRIFSIKSGRVITDRRKSNTVADFIAFLNKVNREVPAELDVHVILDNLSTHKTRAVHQWLLRHKRFHFHFTSTYGSWMNLVERWFSALTTKKLQRSAHRSVKALAADIRDWVEHWSQSPKPFTWHKSAEEILDRLAGYCTAINKYRTLQPDRTLATQTHPHILSGRTHMPVRAPAGRSGH